MRIILATPLYPPDTEAPAPYVKELAKRLSKLHEVTIVAYTHLPETVPGTRIIAVDKRRSLPLRLFVYFIALFRAAHTADILYIENGASVELPVALVTRLTRRPLVVHLGDHAAHIRAQKNTLYRFIERLTIRRARMVVEVSPLSRPEILPFGTPPVQELENYERSWEVHLQKLEVLFNTYAKH